MWFAALHGLSVKKNDTQGSTVVFEACFSWDTAAVCPFVMACFCIVSGWTGKTAWPPLCQETRLMSISWSPPSFACIGNCKNESKPRFFSAMAYLNYTHDGPQPLPFQITQSICSSSLSPKVTNTSCWGRGRPYCSRCLCCDLARRRISSLLVDWFRSCSMKLYVLSKTLRYFRLFI